MDKIRVEGLYKVFGSKASEALPLAEAGAGKAEVLEKTGCVVGLSDIGFSIHAGETFVIMGLSGSGKSTLIRHFNRLIEPTAGRILVDGEDILGMSPAALIAFRRRRVSMVFQRFGLLPHQTVLDNVACGLLLQGMGRREALARSMEQVELVGLKGYEHRFPRQLSGGMQQRVGLARALATEAEILLMDEAFSALDPLIKSDMQEQLKEIQARLKKTIVFITHDLDEALHLGDRIAILKDGELRQVGSGEDVLFRPADAYVERFVRKVDVSRAITLRSAFEPVPVLNETEATPEHCAAMLRIAPGLIVTGGAAPRLVLLSGRDIPAVNPTAAETIEVDMAIGGSFPLLSRAPAAIVTDHGRPLGIITRAAAFKALSRTKSDAQPAHPTLQLCPAPVDRQERPQSVVKS